MFNDRRIAHIAAYFAKKEGGRIAVLKLIKLMYLADRESLRKYGDPMTFDYMFSLPEGPILSRALDYMNGQEKSSPGGWDDWMSARYNDDVALKHDFRREHLDELSEADLEILEEIWRRVGHMNKWELRDYTHLNCPEWKEPPGGGRSRIRIRDVLHAVGKSPEQIKSAERGLSSKHYLYNLLETL